MNLFSVLVCTLFAIEGLAARNRSGMCPQIEIRFGRVRYRQRGKIARFVCNTGYMLAGDRYSVCADGKWDNTFPKCVRATCKDARPPLNGLIYPSHGGAVLNFYCKGGFELRGANITYCDGLRWDNALPTCLPTNFKKCDKKDSNFNQCLSKSIDGAIKELKKANSKYGLPSVDPFALPKEVVIEFGDAQTGLRQKYSNLQLVGLSESSSSKASMDFATNTLTIELSFPKLDIPFDYEANGRLIFVPVSSKSASTITLTTNSTPSYSCDFEPEDICGWNHDLNHNFDWKRLNYATPSGNVGTGPSHDHTKGTGKDGYYMYIESSARNINDTARLISPVYDKSNETICFEFYYHMYGATTGSLRVYLKTVNQTWNLNPENAVFIKNGNQGNRWFRGFVLLGSIDDDYQIVIEGVRGSSYVSDIAIDDVKIIKKCNPDDELEDRETTTEESMSSEPPIAVESCENRCNTNDTQSSDWLITCDCDEGCYERNRCCPDYFDFCVVGTSSDFVEETTEPSSTEATTSTTMRTTKIVHTTMKITIKSTTVTPRFTVKYTKPEETTVRLEENKNDFDEVPVTDAPEVETPGVPIKETEIINDYESDKTFDHHKIEVSKSSQSNTKTIVFGVGVVFGVLFAMVGMAFVARRYQLCRCNKLRLKQSSNGDSQSDVRFLTGDEILDFSLASDYDTL